MSGRWYDRGVPAGGWQAQAMQWQSNQGGRTGVGDEGMGWQRGMGMDMATEYAQRVHAQAQAGAASARAAARDAYSTAGGQGMGVARGMGGTGVNEGDEVAQMERAIDAQMAQLQQHREALRVRAASFASLAVSGTPVPTPAPGMVTPVGGGGDAARVGEDIMGAGDGRGGVGAVRARVDSPPRKATTPDAPVWSRSWLRELTAEEGMLNADMESGEMAEMMGMQRDEKWPPALWTEVAKLCCRGQSARQAGITRWTDSRLSGCVLAKTLFMYVNSLRVTTMDELEKARDGVLEVFPWAFDLVVDGDDAWPEAGASCPEASQEIVAKRLAWFEGVLRLALAGRYGSEMLVRHLIVRDEETKTREASQEETAPMVMPFDATVRELYGADVARAQALMVASITTLDAEPDVIELKSNRMIRTLVARLLRGLRNDEERSESPRRKPAMVAARASRVKAARQRMIMSVDEQGSESVVQLGTEHKLRSMQGEARPDAELYLAEACASEATVRQMYERLTEVSKLPDGGPHTAFATAIVQHLTGDPDDGSGGIGGQDHFAVLQYMATTMSPLAATSGVTTTKKLAWLRDDGTPEGMRRRFEARIDEMTLRQQAGSVARDQTTASPPGQRMRTGASGGGSAGGGIGATPANAGTSTAVNTSVGAATGGGQATGGVDMTPVGASTWAPMPAVPQAGPSAMAHHTMGGVVPPGGTPMEQAMLEALVGLQRTRYGGTRQEDELIDSFVRRGDAQITMPMALAARSTISGDVMHERAAQDVRLRDTTVPGGIARKVEMIASALRMEHIYPGEPQVLLFITGKVSRGDGFKPMMFQRRRDWTDRRDFDVSSEVEVAASGGMRGRAAVRNLPTFEPITDMERWKAMVEGLLEAAHHAADELTCGLESFFKIQEAHYKECINLQTMSWARLYTDLLDRCDKHAKAVDERSLNLIPAIPPWDVLPRRLSTTMLHREMQLREIVDELRAEGYAGTPAPPAPSVRTPTKPPTAEDPPTTLTRREKQRQKREAEKAVAAAKLEAEAKAAQTGAKIKAEPGGRGNAGQHTGQTPQRACIDFARGNCSFGARCRFSHDAAVIDLAKQRGLPVVPAAAASSWKTKWDKRAEPARAQDPPMMIPGTQTIMGPWVMSEDRWTICEQTADKCFKRHVLCDGACNCSKCQAPNGKLWPSQVSDRLRPAKWPG